MTKKKQPQTETKKAVLVYLSQADYERLTEICESRHQTRADFIRDAIDAHEVIPQEHKVKLRGICLERHLDRLKVEKRAPRREGKD